MRKQVVKCPKCNGTGRSPGSRDVIPSQCTKCGGTGSVIERMTEDGPRQTKILNES